MIARFVGVGLCLLAVSSVVFAQDDRPPPREERSFESPRERIETELERVRATEARLERALEMIDDGATPQDIRRMMREGDRRRGERLGRGRRPGAEGRPAAEPLTDEQRERVLGEIKTIAPFMADRLRGLAERRPAAADAMIQRMQGRLAELRELRERDPEMAEIKAAEFKAGLQISRATQDFKATVRLHGLESEQANEKREALREALAAGVDVRLRFHQAEIARLERRIDRARAELAERSEKRDEFIDERLDEMIERIDVDEVGADLPARD